jgi:hypothetical protein
MCALLALSASPAAGQQNTRAAADSIVALIRRYDRAWNGQDTASAGRLLAAEYQYFTSIGELRTRAEMLAFLGSPEYRLQRASRDEVVVRVTGPVAVASTRWRGNGTYRGKRFNDDQRCGLVWLRTGADWRLLSEHCTQIVASSN